MLLHLLFQNITYGYFCYFNPFKDTFLKSILFIFSSSYKLIFNSLDCKCVVEWQILLLQIALLWNLFYRVNDLSCEQWRSDNKYIHPHPPPPLQQGNSISFKKLRQNCGSSEAWIDYKVWAQQNLIIQSSMTSVNRKIRIYSNA